ncbi:hypothetical protein QOZ80_2AG0114370 [Eleusine coracana subsp. coracana]|nr:hypothetical protein QOZ80_2AG0114370 [Eleusine coracana subsp. coracana]
MEPRSGSEIELPPLAHIIQVFLSADPLTATSSSSGWMAVATQLRNEAGHNIFFWRPGDATWNAAAEMVTSQRLHNVVFLGHKMYCLDYRQQFAIYDLNLGSTCPPVLVQHNYIAPLLNVLYNPRSRQRARVTRAAYFVTCNDELLLVVLFHNHHPSFAEVYRPDLTPGRVPEFGERVTDLGGHSIFLGRGDAFALSAEDHPAIKRNCVYYAAHHFNFDFYNLQPKD